MVVWDAVTVSIVVFAVGDSVTVGVGVRCVRVGSVDETVTVNVIVFRVSVRTVCQSVTVTVRVVQTVR